MSIVASLALLASCVGWSAECIVLFALCPDTAHGPRRRDGWRSCRGRSAQKGATPSGPRAAAKCAISSDCRAPPAVAAGVECLTHELHGVWAVLVSQRRYLHRIDGKYRLQTLRHAQHSGARRHALSPMPSRPDPITEHVYATTSPYREQKAGVARRIGEPENGLGGPRSLEAVFNLKKRPRRAAVVEHSCPPLREQKTPPRFASGRDRGSSFWISRNLPKIIQDPHVAATRSPIASEAVSPGNSIPSRAT